MGLDVSDATRPCSSTDWAASNGNWTSDEIFRVCAGATVRGGGIGAGPENTVGNDRESARPDCGRSEATHADMSVVPILRKLISVWMTAPATGVAPGEIVDHLGQARASADRPAGKARAWREHCHRQSATVRGSSRTTPGVQCC